MVGFDASSVTFRLSPPKRPHLDQNSAHSANQAMRQQQGQYLGLVNELSTEASL
jgi:hypothetical protein